VPSAASPAGSASAAVRAHRQPQAAAQQPASPFAALMDTVGNQADPAPPTLPASAGKAADKPARRASDSSDSDRPAGATSGPPTDSNPPPASTPSSGSNGDTPVIVADSKAAPPSDIARSDPPAESGSGSEDQTGTTTQTSDATAVAPPAIPAPTDSGVMPIIVPVSAPPQTGVAVAAAAVPAADGVQATSLTGTRSILTATPSEVDGAAVAATPGARPIQAAEPGAKDNNAKGNQDSMAKAGDDAQADGVGNIAAPQSDGKAPATAPTPATAAVPATGADPDVHAMAQPSKSGVGDNKAETGHAVGASTADPAPAMRGDVASEAAAAATPAAPPSATPAPALAAAQNAPAATAPGMAAVPISGVAVEIVARAQAGSNRFEIRLDPPDLGRIDVRLDVDRQGNVTSHLVVHRSETLDLLRRDAPQLERALQDAGLKTSSDGLQFSLRDQGSGGQNQNAQNQATQDNGAPRVARVVVPPEEGGALAVSARGYGRLVGSNGGLDIRV
jgi:flagellar hook-length control protein FliK